MWTQHLDDKSHWFTAENGKRYHVARINDVGGKRNYSARREGFVNTLIGYSETLDHAKARVEKECAS